MITRSEILEIIQELYREGMLVKALDEHGKPRLLKGQPLYKVIEHATGAERAYWIKENSLN